MRQARQFTHSQLLEADAPTNDPFPLFQRWWDAALTSSQIEPTAMAVASVNAKGQPSLRMVLLKSFDETGFVFYTNYHSRKSEELSTQTAVAATFWWDVLERQVRIEGVVERTSDAEADAYFLSRPTGSRLGAWASQQSRVITDRAALEKQLNDVTAKYGDTVPRPAHWGGWRIVPQRIEFWQGRRDRLHDRLLYSRDTTGWTRVRLQP